MNLLESPGKPKDIINLGSSLPEDADQRAKLNASNGKSDGSGKIVFVDGKELGRGAPTLESLAPKPMTQRAASFRRGGASAKKSQRGATAEGAKRKEVDNMKAINLIP